MNTMTLDGYQALIEYDPELDLFRGEILGLSGGADFYGANPDQLRKEFRISLDTYLEACRERGIEPKKNYSGKFNLRVPAQLHEQLALRAQVAGKSLNTLVQETLQAALRSQ